MIENGFNARFGYGSDFVRLKFGSCGNDRNCGSILPPMSELYTNGKPQSRITRPWMGPGLCASGHLNQVTTGSNLKESFRQRTWGFWSLTMEFYTFVGDAFPLESNPQFSEASLIGLLNLEI